MRCGPVAGVDYTQALFPLPHVKAVLGDQDEVIQQAMALKLVDLHLMWEQERLGHREAVIDVLEVRS